ncbi:glycosyltransferase [Rothia sp. CCM 9419]|uniref:glycosyltransferase n=1 Tax=Rothia sp. CCM 9419 TaxID=3402662 RepID=UPI003ADAD10F
MSHLHISQRVPNSATSSQDHIVAVVVTYNRLDLLRMTMEGIRQGACRPDCVVVVNNDSTDGTAAYLDDLEYDIPLDIIHLSKNTGGAGGFAVGIDRALFTHQADLVWVMDDDTQPLENTLLASYRAWRDYSVIRSERPAFVASRVVWKNGLDHPMNTMRTMFGATRRQHQLAQKVGGRPIRSGSFVSLLMDAAVMRRVGLPWADFFIWNDDFEYSTRLAHHRHAIAVADSVVVHHTKTFGTTDADPGKRFYNDVRNKIWVFTRCRTLTPLEKVLYSGSTVRLWCSTLLRTSKKKKYAGYFYHGIKSSLKPFRSNQDVLAGAYDFSDVRQQCVSCSSPEQKFSVLMSTYSRDDARFLDRAIASNTVEQNRAPDEFVLVKDGVLTPELDEVIERWCARSRKGEVCPIKVVSLPRNAGLANALNEGLKECSYDVVARADADDISLPHRFERQLPELVGKNVAVLGSSMFEVSLDASYIESERHAVLGSEQIRSAFAHRNPMFHPTVIFRKSAVEAVGGYEEVPGAEDYWLWSRMNAAGFVFQNIADSLVKYRTGAGVYTRRGGVGAFTKDVKVQQTLYNGGMINKTDFVTNLGVRLVYRFVPVGLRKKAFRSLIGSGQVDNNLRKEKCS